MVPRRWLCFRMSSPISSPSLWIVRRQPAWPVTLAGVAVTILLGVADYNLTPSTDPLYLLPVAFTTWLAGPRSGLLVALCSTAASYVGEQALVATAGLSPEVAAWNALANLLTLLPATFVLSLLHDELLRARASALTDHLTGVANARGFTEAAEAEIRRARRYSRPLTIAYLDADNFKVVNDQYGHSRGDEVLRLIARSVRPHLRLTDIVARVGGDEFGILLPETGPAQAHSAIEKLRATLKEQMAARRYPVTFSVGVVTFVTAPLGVDDLLRHADGAMYEIKNGAKDGAHYAVVDAPGG